jgi:hypothetical protein
MGEPLLYPGLSEAVRTARRNGLEAWVTTNGSLLTPPLLNELREAGLTHLTISLQTPDAPTFSLRGARLLPFEQYRERVIGAVRAFLLHGEGMHLSICFLANPLRRFHAPDAPRMRVGESGSELRAHMGRWVEWIFGGTGFEGQIPRLLSRVRKAGILWNGDYVICCADYDGKTVLGNFAETSLPAYLSLPAVQEIAGAFRRYRVVHPHCQQCLGDRSAASSLVRQLGSIIYFKIYRRLLEVN